MAEPDDAEPTTRCRRAAELLLMTIDDPLQQEAAHRAGQLLDALCGGELQRIADALNAARAALEQASRAPGRGEPDVPSGEGP